MILYFEFVVADIATATAVLEIFAMPYAVAAASLLLSLVVVQFVKRSLIVFGKMTFFPPKPGLKQA